MCIHTHTQMHEHVFISCWEAAQASCGDQTAALTYHLSHTAPKEKLSGPANVHVDTVREEMSRFPTEC